MNNWEVNLLRIRPMGVVSKKDRGACMVLSNRASWIFCEAAALLNAAPIVLNMPVVVQNRPSKLQQTKFLDSDHLLKNIRTLLIKAGM